MRCRPGDIAIVTKVGPMTQHCLGHIVTVTKRYGKTNLGHAAWHYTPALKYSNGLEVDVVEDCALRPLRDNNGTDETLRKKKPLRIKKPKKETA